MFVLYRFNRLAIIRNMRWEFGSVLPADVRQNLSEQEVRRLRSEGDCYISNSFKILIVVSSKLILLLSL